LLRGVWHCMAHPNPSSGSGSSAASRNVGAGCSSSPNPHPGAGGESADQDGGGPETAFRRQFYKTTLCRFHRRGCLRGSRCSFAHGVEDLRQAPDLTKTSICPRWKDSCCPLQTDECPFAHGWADLRATPVYVASGLRGAPTGPPQGSGLPGQGGGKGGTQQAEGGPRTGGCPGSGFAFGQGTHPARGHGKGGPAHPPGSRPQGWGQERGRVPGSSPQEAEGMPQTGGRLSGSGRSTQPACGRGKGGLASPPSAALQRAGGGEGWVFAKGRQEAESGPHAGGRPSSSAMRGGSTQPASGHGKGGLANPPSAALQGWGGGKGWRFANSRQEAEGGPHAGWSHYGETPAIQCFQPMFLSAEAAGPSAGTPAQGSMDAGGPVQPLVVMQPVYCDPQQVAMLQAAVVASLSQWISTVHRA